MIHQYKNNGYNIVMDIASGSVHVMDPVAYDVVEVLEPYIGETEKPITIPGDARQAVYDILGGTSESSGYSGEDKLSREISSTGETYPADDNVKAGSEQAGAEGYSEPGRYSRQEIDEALDDIQSLIDAGELFTKDIYQDAITDFKSHQTVVKALCLSVAHDCNLACRYCFAGEGEYHGRRALMPFEVGKKALDFLIENSGNRVNLEVDFFGGEPLMDWDVIEQLVEYGRSQEAEHNKRFRFTVTTNGMLLNDEIMDFCNREMSNVVMSLDGRREINDFMRPTRNGKGSSYDIIVPKFQKLAAQREALGLDYYIRGTFTHYNLDFCEDVKHFADLGFRQLSMEPVVADESEDYAIHEEDLPQIFEQYDELAKEYLKRRREGRGFNFFHFMIDLDQGPCVYKRLSGCGSGNEYLAITPWGDIYPCHQFIGEEEFLMGNLDTGITRTDIRDDFKCCNVYAKEECRNCFARFYCSGGCAANGYHSRGHITDTYELGCAMEKKRIECAIMIKAAIAEEET